MSEEITLRFMAEEDVGRASRLVADAFREAIAPHYSPEGVAEFLRYAAPEAMASRAREGHFTVLACLGADIAGVAEVRGDSHLAMLFVSTKLQRAGIGRRLLRHVVETCLERNPGLQGLTVNASPNSVSAYETLGFVATGPEVTVNGIRSTPMSLKLSEGSQAQMGP